MAYRRILVGTDGSETAALAVRHAAGLAKAHGAQLVLVSAYGQASPLGTDGVPDDLAWTTTGGGQAQDKLDAARAVAREEGLEELRTVAAQGDPAEVLVSTAEELLCDAIVMGNKGMSGASRFLLGSVPNRVAHHAPCDVLIIRTT